MAGWYELIPGLKEAEEKDLTECLEAFVGIEPEIAGIEVVPMTARIALELEGAGSPFMSGRTPVPSDLAMFLHRIWVHFERSERLPLWKRLLGRRTKKQQFAKYLAKVPFGKTVLECEDYVDRSFQFLPRKSTLKKGSKSHLSVWISSYVHMLAKHYGWSRDMILDMPLREGWQYLNRIMEDVDPEYKQISPRAAKLKAEFAEKANAGQRGTK